MSLMPCGLHPRVFLQGHRKIWIHLLHGSPISYWSIHTSPSFLKYKDDMIFKSLIILVTHFLSLLLPFPLSLANYRSFLTGLPESESVKELVSCSVMSDSLWPQRLYTPWDSPGQNTGVGSFSLLQEVFPTQGSNRGLPHYRQILYQLSHKEAPILMYNNYYILLAIL